MIPSWRERKKRERAAVKQRLALVRQEGERRAAVGREMLRQHKELRSR